jgi:peptidoglycan/xylan/chitin deacetylase (PgdA/CDA1 family)
MLLLYHAIVSDSATAERCCIGQALTRGCFERQIRWLKKQGDIVPLAEYIERAARPSTRKRMFSITFDDGMACTFEQAYPVLRELDCPATFFVSTVHLQDGPPLWFSYLNALCFEGIHESICCNGETLSLQSLSQKKEARRSLEMKAKQSGRPDVFCAELAGEFPLPERTGREYSGMTTAQIEELCSSNLFEIGAHTVNHPFLSQTPISFQAEEICRSKHQLAELTKRRVRYFSYPGGDYSSETIELVKAAGFDAAFATIPHRIGRERKYEIGRVGIYSQSFLKFCLKAWGLPSLLQRVGITIG